MKLATPKKVRAGTCAPVFDRDLVTPTRFLRSCKLRFVSVCVRVFVRIHVTVCVCVCSFTCVLLFVVCCRSVRECAYVVWQDRETLKKRETQKTSKK